MGLFSGFNFPWTDLHTLNLDWLLRSVKSLLDRYNPVAKSEDMTQPVGVDETGKLYTKPSEEPPHADGSGYGTVNPVGKNWDGMTRRVGVDSDGRLFAQESVHANGNVYGTVNPITATANMTQPVGVNDQGRLFTNPGGGGSGETKALLYTIGDDIVNQTNKHYQSETFWSNYDYYEIEIGCNTANDDFTEQAARLTYKAYWNRMQLTPVGIACFSYDADSGVLYRVVTPNGPNELNYVNISAATSLDDATTHPDKCHILNIYGIRKGEA